MTQLIHPALSAADNAKMNELHERLFDRLMDTADDVLDPIDDADAQKPIVRAVLIASLFEVWGTLITEAVDPDSTWPSEAQIAMSEVSQALEDYKARVQQNKMRQQS